MEAGRRAPAPWTCSTCAATVTTRYCPDCGDHPVPQRDLTLRGLLRQLIDALSSIDGRLIRSLRVLVSRPGALTVAYVHGPRKPYLGPFQLFLLANVVFVAAQSLTGANVFSSPLESHLRHQDWSGVAQRLVAVHLESRQTTLDAYAPIFNQAVAFHAKSLVIVMAIPFAMLLPALFFRSRRPFVMHLVFAVHVYAFLLLLYSAALVIAALNVWRGGAGLESPGMDALLTVLNLAACAVYLHLAIREVYGARGISRVAASLALAVAILGIALAYRFALLILTLYVT